MKAVAVFPGTPDSIHLADLPEPQVDDVPEGRGVLVEVLRVGVDGTDKEINDAEYGAAPEGYDFLVTGHESFGRVLEVGTNVRDVEAGDYVVATVRRPGDSIYDRIGTSDMTTDETYRERGINLLHGYLTERYVDDAEFIVGVPAALSEVGVLLEPTSIVEKGIEQAYEIQRRLKVWRPARAAVVGAGTLGLLATLALRLRGLDVTTLARTEPPTLNSGLVEDLGARYLSTREVPLVEAAERHGPFDVVFEATDGRDPWHDEGRGGCRHGSDPGLHDPGYRGRRDHVDGTYSHDGRSTLHGSPGRPLRPPNARRVVEQAICYPRRVKGEPE